MTIKVAEFVLMEHYKDDPTIYLHHVRVNLDYPAPDLMGEIIRMTK